MNTEYMQKVHLTFQTTKGTSELLKQFAHIKGMTQPELIDRICQTYLKEAFLESLNIIPENTLQEILKTQE